MAHPRRSRQLASALGVLGLAAAALVALGSPPAGATTVLDEATFRAAWTNPAETQIDLAADITLTQCGGLNGGTPTRNSATALTVTGNGHSIRQTCMGAAVVEQGGSGALSFDAVTITGGNFPFSGGGIITFGGSVAMTNSTVSGNTAAAGGGIFAGSGASVTVTNSTVSENTAAAANPGGGIFTEGGGSVTVTNSTVSGNTTSGSGGGIFANGEVTLVYATVAGNNAPVGANVDGNGNGALASFGSVVALPGGGGLNCAGLASTTSNGSNLSDDASCGFTGTGDHQNAGDPGLGALASNGGPTETRLPQAGSPLIDAIPAGSCQADGASGISSDQRGVTRPQGPGCDIGAVEVEVSGPTPSPTPAPSPSPAVPVTAVVRFTG